MPAINQIPADSSTISMVVINYNGGQKLLRCLQAAVQNKDMIVDLILVDNGSTDGSPEQALQAFPHLHVLSLGNNPGPTVARNRGLEQARSDLVLLLDHDIYLTCTALQDLLKTFEEKRPLVVCPRIVYASQPERIQMDGAAAHFTGTMTLYNHDQLCREHPPVVQDQTACGSGCMLVKRKDVLAMGGFNENYFTYFDDLEFCLRLSALGHRIVLNSHALVLHDAAYQDRAESGQAASKYPRKKIYYMVRHRLLTLLIIFQVRSLLVLSPVLLVYEFAQFAAALLMGGLSDYVKAWKSIQAARVEIKDQRRVLQKKRVVPDHKLLSGGKLPFSNQFLGSKPTRVVVTLLSGLLNLYWFGARYLIG